MSTVAGGKVRVYRSTETLGRWVRGLLTFSAVAAGYLGICDLVSAAHLRTLSRSVPPLFGPLRLPLAAVPAVAPAWITLTLSTVGIGTTVVWLVWQHRSQSNLFAAAMPGLAYTPGWAVGWWFVPVADLFMPYRTVRELWSRSGASARRSPVGLWWSLYIGAALLSAGAALGQVLSGTRSGGVLTVSLTAVADARTIDAAAAVVRIVAAIVAVRMVSEIDRAEQGIRALAGPVSMPPAPGVQPPRPDLGLPPG
jgi:hypothetical protein